MGGRADSQLCACGLPGIQFETILYALLWQTVDEGLYDRMEKFAFEEKPQEIAHVVMDSCGCGVRGRKLPFFDKARFLNRALRDETAAYNTEFARETEAQFLSVLQVHTVPQPVVNIDLPAKVGKAVRKIVDCIL